MKRILLVLVIFLVTIQSYAQAKNFLDKAYLETTATVDSMVVPDKIYLSILLTEKDTKGKVSVEELEKKMEGRLKALGIDTKKQLSLSDVTSNFKKYFLKSKDVLKNKAYTLVVYDAKTAGKVIVGLEHINISNVHLSKTEYSKMKQLKMDLTQKAVRKAKLQAKYMLQPLNQKLGKALYISDMKSNVVYRTPVMHIRGYSKVVAESDYNMIDIEFEKIKVESTVMVKFEIE